MSGHKSLPVQGLKLLLEMSSSFFFLARWMLCTIAFFAASHLKQFLKNTLGSMSVTGGLETM